MNSLHLQTAAARHTWHRSLLLGATFWVACFVVSPLPLWAQRGDNEGEPSSRAADHVSVCRYDSDLFTDRQGDCECIFLLFDQMGFQQTTQVELALGGGQDEFYQITDLTRVSDIGESFRAAIEASELTTTDDFHFDIILFVADAERHARGSLRILGTHLQKEAAKLQADYPSITTHVYVIPHRSQGAEEN